MKLTMHLGSRSYDIILKRGCLATCTNSPTWPTARSLC